jgi:hypothetical protein
MLVITWDNQAMARLTRTAIARSAKEWIESTAARFCAVSGSATHRHRRTNRETGIANVGASSTVKFSTVVPIRHASSVRNGDGAPLRHETLSHVTARYRQCEDAILCISYYKVEICGPPSFVILRRR